MDRRGRAGMAGPRRAAWATDAALLKMRPRYWLYQVSVKLPLLLIADGFAST
jgi:hypothetical protein